MDKILFSNAKRDGRSRPFYTLNLYYKAALFGLEAQFVAEVGVCNGDEGLYSLIHRTAAELCNTILGDDMVNIVLAGGNYTAGRT